MLTHIYPAGVCVCVRGESVCGCPYSLKDTYGKVYSSIVGNDQNQKQTQCMSTVEWINNIAVYLIEYCIQ